MTPTSQDPTGTAGRRRGRRGRVLLWAAVLTLATVVPGCGSSPRSPGDPGQRPTRAGDCNDMPHLHGDPGFVLGFDWHRGEHRYDETVVVHVCASDSSPSTLTLEPLPHGVTASPSALRLAGTGDGVIPVRLTVAPGAAGVLTVTQSSGGGSGGSARGPRVVSGDDGWHLARSD